MAPDPLVMAVGSFSCITSGKEKSKATSEENGANFALP